MAIYLVEIIDEKGNGTGKFKDDIRPGADSSLVQARVESDRLKIISVKYPGTNHN